VTIDASASQASTRLYVLAAVLFISYLCVAIPLPVLPVHVAHTLGLSNALAGLVVGVAFLSTILTRGMAGRMTDRDGAKRATSAGLGLYVVGALVAMASGPIAAPPVSLGVLVLGRLIVGLGESLVGVGIIGWGIALVGPARSGRVLALVGAAIYGAFAVGGPIGVALADRLGFSGTMAVAAVLPAFGLGAVWLIPGSAPLPQSERPSMSAVLADIWRYGLIVCLQGIGFAAIGAFFVLYFLDKGWALAGLSFTLFGAGFVLMRVLFGGLQDRIGGLPVAIASLSVEIVGQALIWAAPNAAVALAGAFLTGVGCSLIFPAMGREVVHRVQPHLRATALGGFSAFQDLAYGLTGPLAGLLADKAGFGSVFLVGMLAAASGLVMALSLRVGSQRSWAASSVCRCDPSRSKRRPRCSAGSRHSPLWTCPPPAP